ncbi:MAG: hypothetical protein V1855_01710 [bacterium]
MKKSNLFLILISFVCLCVGIFIFLLHRDFIVFKWVGGQDVQQLEKIRANVAMMRKDVKYYFFKDNAWHHEEGSMIWDVSSLTRNIKLLVSDWLVCVQGENFVSATVFLNSVAFSFGQETVFLNFNKSLFPKNVSIHYKWRLIESLLRTMREADVGVQSVRFFVEDSVLRDDHLDFSQPWPIAGFCI